MEREKAVKIGIASVIGLAAIVILAMNFIGKGPQKPAEDPSDATPVADPGGGPRQAPGGGG